MPFSCPKCGVPDSLQITARLELPPDDLWDELTLQVVACSTCRFRGLALYTESRRGALDSECWQHTGYCENADEVGRVERLIQRCPDTANHRCSCSSHMEISRNPALLNPAHSFPMQIP